MALYDAAGLILPTPNPDGPDQADLRQLSLPGTLMFSGFILEEQNPALQGRRGMDVWKAMGHDPTVGMLLKVHELPQRAATWEVEPADDSQQAADLADFVHYNLWEFGVSGAQSYWDDTLRQATTGRNQYGFAPFELIYRIDNDRYPGKVCLERLSWMAQWTRYKWNIEEIDLPDGGRMRKLISMTQWAPPFYQFTVVPADKMALFARDQNGENYDGVPLLRPIYKPWYIRDRLYSIQSVGLERGYMGVPVGKLPMLYTADMKKLMVDIVQGFRTHERAGAVIREDMSFEMLFNKLQGAPMQEAIQFFTTEMARSCLAQFTVLGSTNVGSFALSTDQSDLFLMSLNADANYTCDVMNGDPVIPKLIRYNWANTPSTMMPKLTHGEIGQQVVGTWLRGLGPLFQWGALVPDDGIEDALRRELHFPEREGTVTPEYLQSLLQSIQPEPPEGRRYGPSRPPIPAATNPQAQGTRSSAGDASPSSAGPGGPGVPGVKGGSAPFTQLPSPAQTPSQLSEGMFGYPTRSTRRQVEAAYAFNEARARMPFPRPKGRLTDIQRQQIRATEAFLEFAEASRPSGKPMLPSKKAAMRSRAYHLTERAAGIPAQTVAIGERTTVTRPEQVAGRHKAALRDLLAAQANRKPKPPGTVVHVTIPQPNGSPVPFAERPAELVKRPAQHIHDQNGQVDDQPCVAFDLNSTLTPAQTYPIQAPPYPGMKALLDKLSAQGCCIHVTSAGLYVADDKDLDVQRSRLSMCEAWATEYGLPVQIWLPKHPATLYVDDRMVPAFGGDAEQMGAAIQTVLERRFKMGDDGIWHRVQDPKKGAPVEAWPDPATVAPDAPRGFSGPSVDIDIHMTAIQASSSTTVGGPMPGAQEAIAALYNAGVTVYLSCAGWNPATKADPDEVAARLAEQRQQLRNAGIPYDRLVAKDHCEVYADDKGVPFTTWEETLPVILQRLGEEPTVSPEHGRTAP
jgi:hypothetical protein